MPAGVPPWYLPGGMAMVRGGQFVIDADECCCECNQCPTRAWCIANCAAAFFVDLHAGDCCGDDCDGLYTLVDRGFGFSPSFHGSIGPCVVFLQCALYTLVDWYWVLYVISEVGACYEACVWHKKADCLTCPEGTYTSGMPPGAIWPVLWTGLCDNCIGEVVLYS